VTSVRGAAPRDGGLDQLRHRCPRWRIWRGHITGGYRALPPRDHSAQRKPIGASGPCEPSQRLTQTQGRLMTGCLWRVADASVQGRYV
jgi:hypothetical protein